MGSALEDALPGARARWALLWSVSGLCLLPSLLTLAGIDSGADAASFHGSGSAAAGSGPWGEVAHGSLMGSFGHTLIEWTAFCTAVFTAILGCAYFSVRRDNVTAIIAIALFWAGCMDALHIGVAAHLVGADASQASLIPLTWTLSRCFNALLPAVALGIILAQRSERPGTGSYLVLSAVSLMLGAVAYGLIEFLALSQGLPRTVFASGLLTRPWDLAPLFLYLAVGCLVAAALVVHPAADVPDGGRRPHRRPARP